METTISVGTWIIPSIFTFIVYLIAYLNTTDKGGDYGIDLSGIFYYGGGTILVLISWLIWSLL